MKILIVQLLRLGDVVSLAPVIAGLRRKHPQAQIDLLINRESEKVAPLLSGVDQVIYFERKALQKGLGEEKRCFFESYDRLEKLVNELNHGNYQVIYNFTQNRLSGRLMSSLRAEKKVGLCYSGEKVVFESPWMEHLNRSVSRSFGRFHFTDVFKYAAELPSDLYGGGLKATEQGEEEALQAVAGFSDKIIALQPYTSDRKKDWSEERWIELVGSFDSSFSQHSIAILGAPFEADKVEALVDKMQRRNSRVKPVILSVPGVYSFLQRCEFLVTGDTSIKHLAAAAGTPLLEISLGSSDCWTTGPYQDQSVILRSREDCQPCPASEGCHRKFHACAQGIEAETVAMIVRAWRSTHRDSLRAVMKEVGSEVRLLTTHFSELGDWCLIEEGAQRHEEIHLSDAMSRISWKYSLKQGPIRRETSRNGIDDLGSECFAIQAMIPSGEGISEYQKKGELLAADLEKLKRELGRMIMSSATRKDVIEFQQKVLDLCQSLSESHETYRLELMELLGTQSAHRFEWVKESREHMSQVLHRQATEQRALRFFEENFKE